MKKTITIIMVVLIVLTALWYYFVFIKKKKNTGEEKEIPKPDTAKSFPHVEFPFTHGAYGFEILMLQAYLNKNYDKGLVCDGLFGAKTLAAFKDVSWAPLSTKYSDSVNSLLYTNFISSVEEELIIYLKANGIEIKE